jgi:hypothetical protein
MTDKPFIDTTPPELTEIDTMPTDGSGFTFNGKPLEPFSVRRQVLFQSLRQRMPQTQLKTSADFFGEACIILFLCSVGADECNALCRAADPYALAMDWAELNIHGRGGRVKAISLALDIWNEANAEVSVPREEGGEGKSAAMTD